MRGVILAAGEGSRLRPHTARLPKAFLNVNGRPLFDQQLEVLEPHVDGVTVVLGYRHDRVVDRIDGPDVVVFEEWAEYENAESLRRALRTVEDDVLVLNGDVLVAGRVVEELIDRHAALPAGWSVVGCLPGVQSEHTAVRTDPDGVVTAYGMIPGHRHAGIGVLDADRLAAADVVLRAHRDDWYPNVYPAIPTEAVVVPERLHVEINRPADLAAAESRVPLDPEGASTEAFATGDEPPAGSGQ